MAITQKQARLLRERDPYCVHCGVDTDLVWHHRKNRQAGGSKLLDRLDNIIMVCSLYNGLMESDADVANQAREYGHKLRSWDDFSTPLLDTITGTWYLVDEKGNKGETEPPSFLI
jgi:hypothetical protein